MKINTDNKEVLDLFPVEINDGDIKISLKNGSTLTLTPIMGENSEVSYDLEYLTGKENKSIEKLQKKIRDLQDQVYNIKDNGLDNGQSGEEDENPDQLVPNNEIQ